MKTYKKCLFPTFLEPNISLLLPLFAIFFIYFQLLNLDSIENLKEKTISYSRVKNKARKGNTSKYRGVTFNKEYKKYDVRLSVEGVRRVIGKYQNEIDAAKRYDEVAKELIGEDAVLNFPEEK